MWDMRKISALKGSLRRLFMLFAAVITAAIFANIGLSQPTYAADAIWVGSTLKYEDNDYAPISSTGLPAGDVKGKVPYAWIDNSSTPAKAHVIYFEKSVPGPDGENIQARTSAVYVVYNFTPPSTYSGLSPPVTTPIKVTRDLTTDSNDQNQEMQNTCDGSITKGLGWIICPVSNYIADGIDGIFSLVQDFLDVRPITKDDTGLYQMWDLVRNLANICFIIIFLVIIYSHLTSAGYSNYNIKDMLPRLIIASILVNASFWICALGVDLSNTVAHSTHAVMENIRENMTTGADVSWKNISTYILSAGAVAVPALAIASSAAIAFSGAGYLLLAALLSVAFSVLVAFVILAARHALIIMFVVISPLAFVAFVLPSTKSWFSKWLKTFTMLMLFAVIFSFIYGGSQLAGALIMNSADGRLHIVLLGMMVQFLPLMLSLIIPRLATGILGQIANITNDKSKGLLDRSKGWAMDNAEAKKRDKLVDIAKKQDALNEKYPGKGLKNRGKRFIKGGNPLARAGLGMDNGRRRREATSKENDEFLGNRSESIRQKQIADKEGRYGEKMHGTLEKSHEFHKRQELYKGQIDKAADAHWQKTSLNDQDIYSRNLKMLAAERQVKAAQDEWESILTEASAGRIDDYGKKFGPASADVSEAVVDIKTANEAIATEGMRKERAEYVGKVSLNKALQANSALLQRAAGIDEEGADKVMAKLQQQSSNTHMENVGAAKTVFSNDGRYGIDELERVYREGILVDGKRATITQRHAAIQQIAMEVGNNFAIQDMLDFSHDIGAQATVDSSGNAVYKDLFGNVLDDEEVTDRRDTQQIIVDAYRKGGNRVDYHSGTDQGTQGTGRHIYKNTKSGRPTIDTKYSGRELGIAADINKGKVDHEKAFKTDIDVLATTADALARGDVQADLIDQEAAKQYAKNLKKFLKDDQTGMKLSARERGAYHIIIKELKEVAAGRSFNLSDIDDEYVDVANGKTVKILKTNRISANPPDSSKYRPDATNPIRIH